MEAVARAKTLLDTTILANDSAENQHESQEPKHIRRKSTDSPEHQDQLQARDSENWKMAASRAIRPEPPASSIAEQPTATMPQSTPGLTHSAHGSHEANWRVGIVAGSPHRLSQCHQAGGHQASKIRRRPVISTYTQTSSSEAYADMSRQDLETAQPQHQMAAWENGALRRIMTYHLGVNDGEIDFLLTAEWQKETHFVELHVGECSEILEPSHASL